ncbi:MAG TPA: tetratricopeptide repeat protein [Bacteroidota bacterium]|nr:tetratricopeptide repeat protein [Bacteroidota bacterium]
MKTLTALILILFVSALSPAQNTKENADLKLAMNLYNDKMYDLALEQFKQFIANNPKSGLVSDALFYLGLTQRAAGKLQDARSTFQNFALTYADNSKAPEAFWYVGELFAEERKLADAASAFERIKVFYPKSSYAPKGLLQASEYFDKANDSENAAKVLKSLISDYPADELVPVGHLRLGMIYLKQNNFTAAKSELSQASEAGVNKDLKASVLFQLGKLAEQTGNSLEAEKLYRSVFDDKTSPAVVAAESRIALAALLTTTGRSSEATEQLKKVTIDSTKVPREQKSQILYALALAYETQRDAKHAAEYWERYLASPSAATDSTRALIHAGIAYTTAKDYKRALARLTAAADRAAAPADKKEALLRSASIASVQGDNALAAEQYQKFAALAPNDDDAPEALFRAASLLRTPLHELARATSVFKKMIASYPRTPLIDEAIFSLGRTLEEQEKPEQAIELYDEIIQQYPSSDFTAQAQARREALRQVSAVDRNETFKLLASILSDIVSNRPKFDLAMKLGDLYSERLKDFALAAAQYGDAETLAVDENGKEAASYKRIVSMLKLSEADTSKQDETRAAVAEYLKRPHNKKYFEEASVDLFTLQARTASSDALIASARQVIGEHPMSPRLSEVRLALARALEMRGSLQESIDGYRQILQLHPSSVEIEEATARLGMQLAHLGMSDSAVTVMNTYLRSYPKGRWRAEVLREKGLAQLVSGSFTDAVATFEKLRNDYFYTRAASQSEADLARGYRRAGMYENALALYKNEERRIGSPLSMDDSKRALLMVNLARTYDESGDIVPAAAGYASFVREYPEHDSASAALSRLAQIEQENGHTESAIHYLTKSVQTRRTADNTRRLADLLFENAQYPKALAEYEQLLGLVDDPAVKRATDRRVITSLFRSGKLKEAEVKIKTYENMYEDDEDAEAEFTFEKAMVEFRAERYQEALSVLKKFPSKYDNTTFVDKSIFWTGKIYEATNQPDSALSNYMRVMRSFPNSEMLPKTFLALGNIFFFREQYDDAIKYYRMIVDKPAVSPDLMPFAMNNIIEAYKEVGQNEIALDLTRKFIERYPMHESIQNKKIDLGVLYQKLGYYDRAIVQLQAMLETTDKDLESEIRYYLGETYFNKGDYPQAILEFLKVPYLVNKRTKIDWTPNSYYMAGQSYEKMGKSDQALNMYQQIVDKPGIDPTFKSAAQKEIARVKGAVGTGTSAQ